MLEPSKPRPSSNMPSSSLPTGIVKCCDVPIRSVKRRSTAFTSFSRQRARTSRGVMGQETGDRSQESGDRSQRKKRAGGDGAPPAPLDSPIKPLTTYTLLDKQHLLVRRQRPEVVGDIAFELVGELADLGHRRQDLVAEVL